MKKELLNEVERNYFEVNDDTSITLLYYNVISFCNAFIKEVIYEYCKDDFYINPRIVYLTNNDSSQFNMYSEDDIRQFISDTNAWYAPNTHLIVINLYTILTDLINNSKEDIKISKIIETELCTTIIHELSHSVQYDMYNDPPQRKYDLFENQVNLNQEPKYIKQHKKLLNEYLGYDMYGIYISNDPSREKINRKYKYRKLSTIGYLSKFILFNIMDKSKVKKLCDLIFKQDYSIELQNISMSSETQDCVILTKEDFTNSEKFMKKAKVLFNIGTVHQEFYSTLGYNKCYNITLDHENKCINITLWNIDKFGSYFSIQY